MIAISLKFPAKRFHATPWGRQVNEGSVEWPPSPWRLLRSLVATWHHKFPDVPEAMMRDLVELLAQPPKFSLPPASQGHTRHYMPLANDDRTKVFDTFIAIAPDDAVIAIWPDLSLTDEQRQLLSQLLESMSYFGRAESWVICELLNESPGAADVEPLDLGTPAGNGLELVRTLVPISAMEHADWFAQTREQFRQRKLSELVASATAKGKPVDKLKLSQKDLQAIDDSLPATLLDALHADTAKLRSAGWNQPPGTRWVNYARPIDAFAPQPRSIRRTNRKMPKTTIARFAVCGPVRPLLTDALIIGEQVRKVLMGCSRRARIDANTAPVFSGKNKDGSPLAARHEHAHYLCESSSSDGRISHVTVYAPMGFDFDDELAFTRLASSGIWGRDGYELQLVLLGIGSPSEFGGLNEKAGQSRILATSSVWTSRTPFVMSRHLTSRRNPSAEQIANDPKLHRSLIELVRFELSNREAFCTLAPYVEIQPMLGLRDCGTDLGGHFTSWLKFRRERNNGGGAKAGNSGFGFKLSFFDSNGIPVEVTGPIAIGYGCHFGLGQFNAVETFA